PVMQRLRRLEEQFRRFQEVTLSHLQSIARNYNISYNIDSRFRELAEQAEAASTARAALGAKLARLAAAGRRLHRRVKQLERRAPSPRHRPLAHGPGLAEAGAEPRSLRDAVHSQQEPQGLVLPSTPGPWPLKVRQRQRQRLQKEGHQVLVETGTSGTPREDTRPVGDTELPTMGSQEQLPAPQQLGTAVTECCFPSPVCNVGSVLLFPNASASDAAVLQPGLRVGLRALSLCAWLVTPSPRLGTVLSYVTEDEASKLAVHGEHPGSAQFVIGDTAFRQIPVTPLLDGKWHHLCLIWSSDCGQYRFYVDRRLLAAGSGFQQGYEVPAGGSLVLGQQQDRNDSGFGPTGIFVGQLAGLALWSRPLLPGEVASMATGQGLPHGPFVLLADAALQGEVRRLGCTCLEHCP
ncbi:PTX4 protein, partial [Alectura lathami]|nr:PTX4 protein [Alectura lathami]